MTTIVARPPRGAATTIVNQNVLLVDDDPGSIQIMGRILSEVGRLRFATSGEDALRLARESQPDLMLLDAEMPGMSGFQVFEAMKAEPELADVPVIFGGVHPSAVPEVCLENDCVDYVCVGEGEEAMVRLCDALPASRPRNPIPNLWWRDGQQLVRGPAAPFIQDLDAQPFWDKELWADEIRIAAEGRAPEPV